MIVTLPGIDVLFFDNSAAATYASIKNKLMNELKNELMRAGALIEDMDILIAAHAYSRGYTVVTDNLKHFSRIDRLQIENRISR